MTIYKNNIILLLFLNIFFVFQHTGAQSLKSTYQFRETIDLIKFVEQAAEYFEENDHTALIDFGKENSQWYKGDRYIFIYDLQGKCIFHPVLKEFVGKDMAQLWPFHLYRLVHQNL